VALPQCAKYVVYTLCTGRLRRLQHDQHGVFRHLSHTKYRAVIFQCHRNADQHLLVGQHDAQRKVHAECVEIVTCQLRAKLLLHDVLIGRERGFPVDLENAVAGGCRGGHALCRRGVAVIEHRVGAAGQQQAQHTMAQGLVLIKQAVYGLEAIAAGIDAAIKYLIGQL
jgi:hypothetical protein